MTVSDQYPLQSKFSWCLASQTAGTSWRTSHALQLAPKAAPHIIEFISWPDTDEVTLSCDTEVITELCWSSRTSPIVKKSFPRYRADWTSSDFKLHRRPEDFLRCVHQPSPSSAALSAALSAVLFIFKAQAFCRRLSPTRRFLGARSSKDLVTSK